MKSLTWKFDILIYRLFYWRWRRHLENRADIRRLFIRYLNAWEALHNGADKVLSAPPKLRIPENMN